MAKKAAILAVNPVNGSGLFQYIEEFYENGIPYEIFAVADTADIVTNSGFPVKANDVVANLKGRSADYDALVFACGDAIPQFNGNADKQYNKDMIDVIAEFGNAGKIMAGHCAAGLIFEMAGITDGRNLAVHPFVQGAIAKGKATGADFEADGNFFTAQTETAVAQMTGALVQALK